MGRITRPTSKFCAAWTRPSRQLRKRLRPPRIPGRPQGSTWIFEWSRRDSNPGPLVCESSARAKGRRSTGKNRKGRNGSLRVVKGAKRSVQARTHTPRPTSQRPGFPAAAAGYGLLLMFSNGHYARVWPFLKRPTAARVGRELAGAVPSMRPFRVNVYRLGVGVELLHRFRYSAKLGRVVEVGS